MKKETDDRTMVRFGTPDPATNNIKVSRVLPDGTEEIIGQVYPEFDDEHDSIMYCSLNKDGEELLPPSSDFSEIEHHYSKYLQQLDQEAYIRDMEARAEEYSERTKSIKSLRNYKNRINLKFLNR